jgi:plastocyanin
LVSAPDRIVQNVIVALEDVPAERFPKLEPRRLVLDNRECRFVPHAAVLTVGSRIEALNSDPVLHTVHFYGAAQANIALPIKGARIERAVERPGMIVVKCDVHGWMQSFIRVDAHPFHAVTAADGTFLLDGVPAGSHRLSAWHEKLGRLEQAVQVRAGATEKLELEYTFRE